MLIDSPLITGSITVEAGPSGSRPTSELNTGSLFFNTNELSLEVYTGVSGSEWQAVGSASNSQGSDPSGVADIEYVLVAGGAAGGGSQSWGAGGGGAGGYLSSSLNSVESGSTFTITVGGGGAAVTNAVGTSGIDSSIAGTTISTITATGGGGGGGQNSSKTDGADGGSGGGAQGAAIYATAGSGTVGQGNDGGPGADGQVSYTAGGGGGGATTAGQDASTYSDKSGGNGGTGATSKITGTSVERAGGGGGGTNNGSGGSGTGGTATGGGGAGGTGTGGTNGADGTAGTANTGGGGGGAGHGTGAAGGSGVAIFAFPTASLSATGGERTFFNERVAHTFRSSGTFTLSEAKTHTHSTLDIFNDSSCLALYNLDGNANDTGGSYNGTASNMTYTPGYINQVGVFNGSNSQITTTITPGNTEDFSWSLWVKDLTHNSSATSNTVMLDYKNDYKWLNFLSTGVIRGNIRGSDNNDVYVDTGVLTASNWTHIVWVVSTTNGSTMYVNGTSVDTNSTAKSTRKNINFGSGVQFGNNPADSSGNYNLDGKIDQIRIFDKALSSSEVTTLYEE